MVAEYVDVTGDNSILQEEIPFLKGPQLKDNEEEHYETFSYSDQNSLKWITAFEPYQKINQGIHTALIAQVIECRFEPVEKRVGESFG